MLAESTTVYERTSSTWVTDDIAEWGNSSATIEDGLKQTGHNSAWSVIKTFEFAAFSKVTLEATVVGGDVPNRNSSYDYVTIGGVSLKLNGTDQKATIDVDGTSYALSGYARKGTYNLSVTINQATGEVAYEVSGSANGSGTAKSSTALTNVAVGHFRGGREKDDDIILTLSSIKITEEKQEIAIAKYTVNYVFGTDVLKTEAGEIAVNNVVEAISPINIDGQKYYAADGATTSLTVSDDETKNVLNVELRKAYDYAYTVKDNLGDVLGTGTGIEGDLAYAFYPQYKNVDGTLYEAAKQNSGYRTSFTLTEDNYIHTIKYSETDIKNVVYFSEGENIEGATATSAGNNMESRSSNGACGNADNDVIITNLQPGKYKVVTYVYSNSSGGATFDFMYGTETFTASVSAASNGSTVNNDITITRTSDLVWKPNGTGNKNGLDYIYIVRTGDATVSIDLPADYTYSTYCSTVALDFSGNADVEAYAAAVDADGVNVTLTKVDKVPAGEGVVLKKIGDNTTATVKVLASAEALENNALVGVTKPVSAETLIAAGDAYVLVDDTKFSKVVEGATGEIPAGKAYLKYAPVGGGATANVLRFSFGDPTSAASVEAKAEKADNVIYNAQGIRVRKPIVRGLYIMSGKAFMVK